jgi:hypothetical protein
MAKSKKPTKSRPKSKPTRKVTLAGFFRKLWNKPKLLERFSSGKAGRAEVLGMFNLSTRHRKVLDEGCVRDIIQELAGVPRMAGAENTVINTADEVTCGHPECKAFMRALKPR